MPFKILSRKPVAADTPRDPAEDYINSLIVDSLLPAISIQELLLASESDPTLRVIKECLNTGNGKNTPKPFQVLNLPEADDTEIHSSNKDITYAAKRVNEDFTQIEKWLEANEMAAHPGKTEVMMAGSRPALTAAEDIEIYLKNHKLNNVNHISIEELMQIAL